MPNLLNGLSNEEREAVRRHSETIARTTYARISQSFEEASIHIATLNLTSEAKTILAAALFSSALSTIDERLRQLPDIAWGEVIRQTTNLYASELRSQTKTSGLAKLKALLFPFRCDNVSET